MSLIFDSMGNVIGDDGATEPTAVETIAPAQLSYIDRKMAEFQNVLNDLDSTAFNLEQMLLSDIPTDQYNAISAHLEEYNSRKSAFKFAAESLNNLASMVNTVGGEMSHLTIPAGLGFPPLVIPAAYAAAIAGVTLLMSFAVGWLATAKNIAPGSVSGGVFETVGGIAGSVKWVVIGAIAFYAFKMFNEGKRK